MNTAFVTTRLTLSPANEDQLDELWAIWNDEQVRRYLFDNQAVTRQAALGIIQDCLRFADHGYGLWDICLRGSKPLIGCVALMPVGTAAAFNPDLVGNVEPLIALDPAYWHQGYAAEALKAVLRYAFNELNLERIVAVNDVPNEASNRLLERLGFTNGAETDGPHYRLRNYVFTRDAFVIYNH